MGRQRVVLRRHEIQLGERRDFRDEASERRQPTAYTTFLARLLHALGVGVYSREARPERRVVNVQLHRERLLADLTRQANHTSIIVFDVEAHRLEELVALVIPDVHCREHREQEEADPESVPSARDVGVGAHQHRERFSVPELVVAPALEPLEDRMEPILRVLLHLPVDRDVARVADLLRQIRGVVDEFRLEVRVLLRPREERQVHGDVEVGERVIDEPRVASFVSAHEAEQLTHVRILHPLLHLGVQDAA
jgi:hypothetical protein